MRTERTCEHVWLMEVLVSSMSRDRQSVLRWWILEEKRQKIRRCASDRRVI